VRPRALAGFAAILLALVGALLVFTYVGNAEERAVSGLEPIDVLVVQGAVPAGTPVEQLRDHLAVESLPRASVAKSALSDLEGTAGTVTSTILIPGEQLLAERLVASDDAKESGPVEVPKGLQEVALQLEPQRVVGGGIAPGDQVGVFISFEDGGLKDSPGETTQLVFHKTLVTVVQRAPQATKEDGQPDVQALPQGSMVVTLAVDDRTAQKMVFGAEFGRVWLSKEPEDAKESKPQVIQRSEVYR
jgi:pilus assembly protein CpaB